MPARDCKLLYVVSMKSEKNKEVFWSLLRAGLWEQNLEFRQYGDTDFAEVLRLAGEQSVVGLVAAGIERFKLEVPEFKIPQEWVLKFVGHTLQIEQRNRTMNDFLARLILLLRKNGVYALLVKGQGIAQCYERPLWRTAGDIDLLLSESNYEKAKNVLQPLASSVETEYTHFKHQGMTIDGWVVELHGTMQSRLSRRVDKELDRVQQDVFRNGDVRAWRCGDTDIFLPGTDCDIVFVFTHILHHFFLEGVGLRQICDWCRLLWTYHSDIDVNQLNKRLSKMGLRSEWRAFAAFAVEWLGMPKDAMPLYSPSKKWTRKAQRINRFVLKVGNFGHNQSRISNVNQPYLIRKIISFWEHCGFLLRHITIFPLDSIRFFGGLLRSGLYAAVKGE